MIINQSIIKKLGKTSGKKVAVFAGVHGNERAGVKALQKVADEVAVMTGTVYFAYANPPAIEKNVRLVNKNLNRCFLRGNNGNAFEDVRARELMSILDDCDALLDLHASNVKNSTPFIICENSGYDLAKKMDFSIISSGWDALESGSADGYMFNNSKIGICLECGSVHDYNRNADLAEKSIYQFLQYFGCIVQIEPYNNKEQTRIQAVRVAHKKTNDFKFLRDLHDFDMLREGEIFARDGQEKYIAGRDECIIFPNPKKSIGEEVFVIGKKVG